MLPQLFLTVHIQAMAEFTLTKLVKIIKWVINAQKLLGKSPYCSAGLPGPTQGKVFVSAPGAFIQHYTVLITYPNTHSLLTSAVIYMRFYMHGNHTCYKSVKQSWMMKKIHPVLKIPQLAA